MKLSVIVPVYNVALWLRACLDSIRAQTFKDFECICVDDGSTDGSGAILDEYAARDVRLRVIHQPNRGVGMARDAGLGAARGEWICFLDADDILNARTLEVYDLGIRTYADAELVAIGHVRFADGMMPTWSDELVRWRSFDCRKTVPAAVYFLDLWTCAFRAKILCGLQFGALKIGEDRVFFSQVVERVGIAAVSDWVGYGYRQRTGSAYHSRDAVQLLRDEIRHHAILTKTMRSSAKTYLPAIARRRGEWLLENFAEAFYGLASADRDLVWDDWLAEMDAVSGFEGVRPYMRMIMRMVVRTRSKALARLLIYSILWLKLHGVNRRLVLHRQGSV